MNIPEMMYSSNPLSRKLAIDMMHREYDVLFNILEMEEALGEDNLAAYLCKYLIDMAFRAYEAEEISYGKLGDIIHAFGSPDNINRYHTIIRVSE
jgi:hypothetical protein